MIPYLKKCINRLLLSFQVVALNSAQFGSGFPGPNCLKKISISANGKTATAQIVDN
ncbi:hypothetical protein DFH11DRAFT_1611018, partial [Phellopilus nigrolimitatus]